MPHPNPLSPFYPHIYRFPLLPPRDPDSRSINGIIAHHYTHVNNIVQSLLFDEKHPDEDHTQSPFSFPPYDSIVVKSTDMGRLHAHANDLYQRLAAADTSKDYELVSYFVYCLLSVTLAVRASVEKVRLPRPALADPALHRLQKDLRSFQGLHAGALLDVFREPDCDPALTLKPPPEDYVPGSSLAGSRAPSEITCAPEYTLVPLRLSGQRDDRLPGNLKRLAIVLEKERQAREGDGHESDMSKNTGGQRRR